MYPCFPFAWFMLIHIAKLLEIAGLRKELGSQEKQIRRYNSDGCT
jgi:hypothetical protein